MYNILIESGVAMKLLMLIKVCLNETYSRAHVGKHMPIRRVQVCQEGLEFNDTCQLLGHVDVVHILY